MRITSKGQVTIPQAIRERYGLLPDTEVEFVESDGHVTLVPRPSKGDDRGSRAIARLRGSASAGMSTDEILALTRGSA
jgi:antitoxin PrlF